MIKVRLSKDGLQDLPERTGSEFQFVESGNEYVASFSDERFQEFLRTSNLVTYKNNLKEYDDGDIVGEFQIAD